MDGQGGSSPRVARLWLAPRGQPQATRSLAQKPDLTQTIGQTRNPQSDKGQRSAKSVIDFQDHFHELIGP